MIYIAIIQMAPEKTMCIKAKNMDHSKGQFLKFRKIRSLLFKSANFYPNIYLKGIFFRILTENLAGQKNLSEEG